jgi:hypothetical protein
MIGFYFDPLFGDPSENTKTFFFNIAAEFEN